MKHVKIPFPEDCISEYWTIPDEYGQPTRIVDYYEHVGLHNGEFNLLIPKSELGELIDLLRKLKDTP